SLHRFVSTGSKRWIGSEDTDEPEEKRARDKNTPNPAWKLAIAPNIAVLEAMWRDRLIFHLAEERLGETCADLLSRFLCMATAARRNTEITSHASGAVSRNELERRVLLPQKDFRRTLPRMIAAGFIYTTELSRSKEYTSETILCLYSVNLSQVASLLIELAQHTALRVALRAEHEFEQKTRLIEQRYRIETLIEKHQQKLSQLTEQTGSSSSQDEANNALLSQQKESLDSLASSITPSEQQKLDSLTARLANANAVLEFRWADKLDLPGVLVHHDVGTVNANSHRVLRYFATHVVAITHTRFRLEQHVVTWTHPYLPDYVIARQRDVRNACITRVVLRNIGYVVQALQQTAEPIDDRQLECSVQPTSTGHKAVLEPSSDCRGDMVVEYAVAERQGSWRYVCSRSVRILSFMKSATDIIKDEGFRLHEPRNIVNSSFEVRLSAKIRQPHDGMRWKSYTLRLNTVRSVQVDANAVQSKLYVVLLFVRGCPSASSDVTSQYGN
ncbi:DNA-directed RNA polymerase III subunit RPC3, partial [Clonorchis sinensis]